MSEHDDEKVVYFGETDARNRRLRFGIKKKDRSRHLYAIGKTGMGKSTLLENLAIQDIQNGDGICFIDPHGKSADFLLDYVPEHRIKDVVYFAPFDMEYPISFNVMEDVGPEQRYLVASGMMSAFKKIWVDAWSARMEYILGNIMLALLEYPGSTLVGVNRMLTDKDFRKEVVSHISDPSVKSFWVNEYANYTEKFAAEAAPAIQNKVGQFVANPLIRNIIGQPKSSFDIREIMDKKKILIINLSKGRVGEANANLLGSMLITKIYLGAMSRADLNLEQLEAAPNFYLYVDEFQSFANESFADILSEARKYKLNLHIAHQYIEQMTEEVRAAVFGNVGTMCVFRVGAYDAEVLEKEFAPQFTAEDIVNLQKYQMYLKLMIDGVTSPPFSAAGMTPIPKQEKSFIKEILQSSRELYARPRAQVEQELLDWIQTQFGGNGSPKLTGSAFGPGAGKGSNGGNSSGGDRGGLNGGNRGVQGGNNQSRGDKPQNASLPRSQAGGLQSGNQFGHRPQNSVQHGPSREGRDNRSEGANLRNDTPRRPQGSNDGATGQRRSQDQSNPLQAQIDTKNRADKANARESELREAMSLSYLRPEVEEDKKTPKPENLAALREALLSVMNSGGNMSTENTGQKQDGLRANNLTSSSIQEPVVGVETRISKSPERIVTQNNTVHNTRPQENPKQSVSQDLAHNPKQSHNSNNQQRRDSGQHESFQQEKEYRNQIKNTPTPNTVTKVKEVTEDVLNDLFAE